MQTKIREELAPIFEAITIQSPAAVLFRGEAVPVNPAPASAVAGFPQHPLPAVPLVQTLQAILYAHCYARRFQAKDEAAAGSPQNAADASFLAKLSRANHTIARWENGWMIYGIHANGQVSLIKGDRQRSAVPGEFVASGPPGVLPQVGAMVSLQVPRDSMVAQPGFYFVFGDTLSDMWDEHNLLRCYFHSSCELAPDLLDYLTMALNRYRVPFRLKALNDPALYGRTDAIVLYLASRYYEIALRLVRRIPERSASRLSRSVPLFTRLVRPGVGMAEDPQTGESFGMHRCRLTAEGIVDAWQQRDQSNPGRLQAVAARFQQNGMDLDRPYLNPESLEFSEVAEQVDFAYA